MSMSASELPAVPSHDDASDVQALREELDQLRRRLVAVERAVQGTSPVEGPLSLSELLRRLGMSRTAFYRCEDELRRLGLVEVTRTIRTRRFDRDSVEKVRTARLPRHASSLRHAYR